MSSVNDSTNNVTNLANEITEEEVDATKVTVMSCIILLTFIGNLCIMTCILGHRSNMMAKRTYFYMLHLSIADIITAFLTLLPELIWTTTAPNFYGGNFICKTVKFLQMVGPYLSSYVLVMMTVDRYLAICYPLTNPPWTSKESKLMILFAWVISLLLCVPQAFIFRIESEDLYNCRAMFQPDWGVKSYVTWFSFSNFFIPLLVLIFCYVHICIEIWKSISLKPVSVAKIPEKQAAESIKNTETTFMIANGSGNNPNINDEDANKVIETSEKQLQTSRCKKSLKMGKSKNPRNHHPRLDEADWGLSKAKIRSVKQTVAIILTYVGCSTPFIFAQLWITWGSPGEGISNSMIWLFWLLTLNSVMNPWIYLAFNRELRMLVFGWWKNSSNPNDVGGVSHRSFAQSYANY